MGSEPQNIQGTYVRPKIEPQPTAFFDILAENDIHVRKAKIESLSGKDYSRTASGMQLTELLESLAGDQFIAKDRIRMLRKLGEGGFAVVEKAELDHGEGKEPEIVAIKTLKPGLIEDDQDLQELIQEANVLRKLKHKFIVDFRGIGCLKKGSVSEMRSSVFFAEEYMAGGSLKGALVRQMKGKGSQIYRAEDAWRWCLQVAQALDYLHHCKPAVVHRDLKPENVLLTCSTMSTAEAHIADFGLHKRINRVRKARNASYRSLNACQPEVETGTGASALFHDVSGSREASSSDLLSVENSEIESPGGAGGGLKPGGKKKKNVTWKDLEETGNPEEAQETDAVSASNVPAPLAISTLHSSTGGSWHPTRLNRSSSLQSVPEEGPVLVDNVEIRAFTRMGAPVSRFGSQDSLAPFSPVTVVTALDPPGEKRFELDVGGGGGSESEDGSDGNDSSTESLYCIDTQQTPNLLQMVGLILDQELRAPGDDPSEGSVSGSDVSSLCSSFEHKVHGGVVGELLRQGGSMENIAEAGQCSGGPASSRGTSVQEAEFMSYGEELMTNRESGLGGLGDGGDDGTCMPPSPFMRGRSSHGDTSLSPEVDKQPLVTSGLERSDELNEYPSNASAGGTSLLEIHPASTNQGGSGGKSHEGRQLKKGGLSRAVDSFKVANNRKGKHNNANGYPLEGQQRGSSNALDRLEEDDEKIDKVVSLVPDAYSSVLYSLGLSGTGDLSGMVGSLMYMAPEVVKGAKYTEKIDVFAFGLIMYELFIGRLTIVKVLAAAYTPKQMELELQRHARRVAKGQREAIPSDWPTALGDLIQECWHENPDRRPRMSDVITRLNNLEKQGVIHEMEELFLKQLKSRGGHWRCCTIA